MLVKRERAFPPEQVLASVEHSMANNYAGLFTERHGDAVDPGGQNSAKKKGGRGEPTWNWRGFARHLGMGVTMPWEELLERLRESILRSYESLSADEKARWNNA